MIRIMLDCDAHAEVIAMPGLAIRLKQAVTTQHIEIVVARQAEHDVDVRVTREKGASSERNRHAGTAAVVWDLYQLRRYLDSVGV